MVLEVGFEATLLANNDRGEDADRVQKRVHEEFESDLPPELEGKALDLDDYAYEVILAWDTLPEYLKEAIVSIVRSHTKRQGCV